MNWKSLPFALTFCVVSAAAVSDGVASTEIAMTEATVCGQKALRICGTVDLVDADVQFCFMRAEVDFSGERNPDFGLFLLSLFDELGGGYNCESEVSPVGLYWESEDSPYAIDLTKFLHISGESAEISIVCYDVETGGVIDGVTIEDMKVESEENVVVVYRQSTEGSFDTPVEGRHSKGPEVAAGGYELKLFPNPFNPSIEIRLEASGKAAGSPQHAVDIYDVRGQRVASLKLNEHGALTWRARDSAGQRIASGMYLFVCRAPDGSVLARGRGLLLK